jgi:hypothetical protein
MPLFETITDPVAAADVIRRRRYGVIDMVEGRLASIHLRPFPKFVSIVDVLFWGRFYHERVSGNRCRLFYNQPRRCPNYLALKYILSSRDASLASFFGALATLDEIARIKQSDAILADIANFRISERLLARFGWERHADTRWHRNYIKRFYGQYPAPRLGACVLQPNSMQSLVEPTA